MLNVDGIVVKFKKKIVMNHTHTSCHNHICRTHITKLVRYGTEIIKITLCILKMMNLQKWTSNVRTNEVIIINEQQ